MTKTTVKMAFILAVLSVLIASVAGCISFPMSNSTRGSGNSSVAVEVNSQQTASQIGSGFSIETPQAGNQYLILNVTVTNLNQNSLDLGNPFYFKLTAADGTVYQYSPSSVFLDKPLNVVSNTNPGEKASGQIGFEVPQSAKATSLTYSDGINQVITNLSGVSRSTTPRATPNPDTAGGSSSNT
jgi:hypothetical protein